MNPCIVETNLASMMLRRDSRVTFYQPHLAGAVATLSFQTVAEMRQGSLDSNWGPVRLQDLEQFFRRFIIAPYSDSMTSEWARIRSVGRANGRRLEVADAWIAATAAALGAPLLTHDADFDSTSCPGVTVIRYDEAGTRIP
jgi:predicted nucleic acid-binding protein